MTEISPITPKEEALAKKLMMVDPLHRIAWLDANLTSLSRTVFHQGVVKNDAESAERVAILKNLYWELVADLRYTIFSQDVAEELHEVEIIGMLSMLNRNLSPEQYQQFLSFSPVPGEVFNNIETSKLLGSLTYFNMGKNQSIKRMQPAFDMVKALYQQGKITNFFGNVSAGNLDAALLTRYCDAQQNQYRLYQYSRHAARMFGEEAGNFRSLESEFAGINKVDGICIIDAFAQTGESAIKSVKGFREKGFTGPIFFFISRGMPGYNQQIEFKQLSTDDPLSYASFYEVVEREVKQL